MIYTIEHEREDADMPPKKSGSGFHISLSQINRRSLGIILVLTSILSFALWKINDADAAINSIDRSFGTNGIAHVSFGQFGRAETVAIQSDGKIVVAGENQTFGEGFSVARFNPNGTLDASFDGDGKTTTCIHPPACSDRARDLAIQADGKIVVIGETNNGSDYDFGLVRYNADGSLDTSFSGDGKLSTRLREGGRLLVRQQISLFRQTTRATEKQIVRFGDHQPESGLF